jgi:hypothetical protein
MKSAISRHVTTEEAERDKSPGNQYLAAAIIV